MAVGAAGDARDVRGHEGLGQAHGREDSREPPRQVRLPPQAGPNISMLWTPFLHRLYLHVHVSVWWLIMRPGRERHQPPSLQALEGQAT
jgi:hypothetical protein